MAQNVVDVGSIKDRVVCAALDKVGEVITTAGLSATGTGALYKTNSAVIDTTLLGTDIAGAYDNMVLNMTGVLGAGRTATLPTVNAIVSALPNPANGQSYMLRIINSSSAAFSWTIQTNTGWTLNGTMTIAQNTWRDFLVTVTTAISLVKEATLQSVGTGTFS